MTKSLTRGDTVKWNTSQGETTGKVVRKVTGATKVKGHVVKTTKASHVECSPGRH